MIDWPQILSKAKYRDKLIFFAYSFLISVYFYLSSYSFKTNSPVELIIPVVYFGQFYLTAYIRLPINHTGIRILLLSLIHIINFVVFREIVISLSEISVKGELMFEINLAILFLLILIGRNIRIYGELSRQLEILHNWNRNKILFEKPEKIEIHLGEPGLQALHPNEIVYVRTKSSGDHTKIFGIRSAKNKKFREYETTYYANFEEIIRRLLNYHQFKRISQSTIINFKYPYQEKDGIIELEGRRFSISGRFSNQS